LATKKPAKHKAIKPRAKLKAKTPTKKKAAAKSKELLKFPCDFPIKVVGRVGEDFESSMMTIARRHFPELKPNEYTSRLSREANYISLTITVHAKNRAQLDSVYEELSSSPKVIMAL